METSLLLFVHANVIIQEPLGSSDHHQLHFNIKIKSDKTKVKQCRSAFRKGNYKEINQVIGMIKGNITYKDTCLIVHLHKAIVRPQ